VTSPPEATPDALDADIHDETPMVGLPSEAAHSLTTAPATANARLTVREAAQALIDALEPEVVGRPHQEASVANLRAALDGGFGR